MTKKIFSIVAFIVISICTNAQQTIAVTGKDDSGSSGSVSYTVGQILYTTEISAETGSVAKGVQQPYEIYIVTGTKDVDFINLSVQAFPNPVQNTLNLKIDNPTRGKFQYQLFDMQGKLLKQEFVKAAENNISMAEFTPAAYSLIVIENQKTIKTFKIIKN